MTEALFGVLVDVSGSMKSAYALDRSHDASVERTHAILTTIINIVKQEVINHNRRESIFACAFGLEHDPIVTCDLLSLLEYFFTPKDGQQALIDLAAQHSAPHAEPWIRDHLSQFEARILYKGLCYNRSLIPELISLIPSQLTTTATKKGSALMSWLGASTMEQVISRRTEEAVHTSEAYKLAQEIIDNSSKPPVQDMQHPKPRTVQHVSELLDDLLQRNASSGSSSQSLHKRIQELLEPIKPYIFGGTPMCRALNDAAAVFRETNVTRKVLFILSDGESADGDPRPIAQKLCDMGVTIATCFLTSDDIDNSQRLYYEADPNWKSKDGRRVLFEMSSSMKNTHTPISYLVDVNWELPPSGESRLFIQANSLDVVNEFCEIVVSQLTKHCDALVDILEKVDLATYINQRNAEFEPKRQEGGTCYANAIAAVFHLAMSRIRGREGGVPDFYKIRERIIREYGVQGANTKKVLENVCPEYRLHFRQVNETGARQAINKRRPVVARFSLYDEQWDKFSAFYRKTSKKILKKHDVTGGPRQPGEKPGGHAVVLIGCDPNCLTFMNSWGQDFADGGFFRVEDQSVLNEVTFFDVYWTQNDLMPSEIEAYEREGIKRGKELFQTFPSVQDLSYKCPKCNQNSRVGEFSGHVLEAECPKCHQKFKPTNKEIMQSLYTQAHNL